MDNLKNCPFCDGEAMYQYRSVKNNVSWWILCRKCGNRTDENNRSKEEAFAKWNPRVESIVINSVENVKIEDLLKPGQVLLQPGTFYHMYIDLCDVNGDDIGGIHVDFTAEDVK